MRNELWETIAALADTAGTFAGSEHNMRVTQLSLDLPIELTVRQTESGFWFLAGPPQWRWRTDFDLPLGRMSVRFQERVDE